MKRFEKAPLAQMDEQFPSPFRGEGQDGGVLDVAEPQQLRVTQVR